MELSKQQIVSLINKACKDFEKRIRNILKENKIYYGNVEEMVCYTKNGGCVMDDDILNNTKIIYTHTTDAIIEKMCCGQRFKVNDFVTLTEIKSFINNYNKNEDLQNYHEEYKLYLKLKKKFEKT